MRTVLLTILLAAAALAQDQPVPKIIELRHINAERVRASGILNQFAHVNNVNVDPSGRYLVIKASSPEALAAAEHMIKLLDVPQKNVELIFHILAGGTEAASDRPPAELEPVLKQLRSAFAYKEYRVLDTAFLRTRGDREAGIEGALPGNGLYKIFFRNLHLSREPGGTIRLDNLRFEARMPTRVTDKGDVQYFTAAIHTDVDVRDGQKVVVGKSTVPNSALFLVLSVRVID